MAEHRTESCALPNITRHWRRLGCGAVAACGTCGRLHRLTASSGYPGYVFWGWKAINHE